MIYRNTEGRHPSIVVADGETATLSLASASHHRVPAFNFRPRTTAALLTMAGRPPRNPPRLTDARAFERVDVTRGLVNLAALDPDGRIDGYSVSHVRRVLDALDPELTTPPSHVEFVVPREPASDECGCGRQHRRQTAPAVARRIQSGSPHLATSELRNVDAVRRSVFVPKFLANLEIYSIYVALGDIVVGRNSTLILDSDITFAIAANVLAYQGARIVQRAQYLTLDVDGRMRGSLYVVLHKIDGDAVHMDWAALAHDPGTKP